MKPITRAAVLALGFIALVLALNLATGCATRTVYVDRPVPVEVERTVYVPIERALCAPQPIAEGPPSAVFEVAADRRLRLQTANANAAAVCAVQGTEVPAGQ